MALQKVAVAIQFAEGVDTKTDAKQVAVTKLTDLQNAVFLKNGTLSKRNGYRILGKGVDGATTYANAQGLAKRGDELILFAGAQSYSQRPSSDSWDPIQAVSSVVASAQPTARTGTQQTVPDVATNGGVSVLAWEDSRGGVWASVLEAASSRIIIAATQLDAGGSRPRCCAVGTVLHVYWMNSPNLWVSVVNPASPETFGSSSAMVIDLDPANPQYDAVATFDLKYPTPRPALMAWTTPGGYRVGYAHPSGVLGSAITGLPAPATITTDVTGPIACAVSAAGIGQPNDIAVAWATSSLKAQFHAAYDFPTVGGIVQLSAGPSTWNRITIDFASPMVLWWAGEVNGASNDKNSVATGSISTANAVTAGVTVRGHAIASRAFADNGDVYVALVHPVLFFPYIAICQVSQSMRAQARLLPGLSSGILTRPIAPSVIPLGLGATGATSRRHALCLGYRVQLGGSSGTQFGEQGIQLFTLDFDHDDAYRTAELGRGLYLSGALVQHYDGDRWAESSFHCAPDTASGAIATALGGGGSLTTAQWYAYKLLYEEIDGQGELHPGAVSTGTLVQLTGGNTAVTITVPTYRLTSKRRVRIGVFRSEAAATAPADPEAIEYFRVSSVDPSNNAAANGYVLNDATVDSIAFTDKLADTTIATLEPLYTNGGVLSNDPEQSGGEVIAGGKNRLFWLDPLDGNLVNFSQERAEDTAAEMSAALSVRIDPFGGDIVAIAVMDDNVIVFKETAIFAFGGPGPLADGGISSQSSFTPPQIVTSDVGCKSRSSVANIPLGVVFQSEKGIYLLGRDLQVRRIGDDVWAYRNQKVSRATLLPDRPHVVFLTGDDGGRTLLYDYDRNAWSTLTQHVGVDAAVVGGSYYYLRADGAVLVETPGLYVDGTQHIPMVIETAWIKLSGNLQGWQKIIRALVIGNYLSTHSFRMSYRLDYEPAWSAPADHDMSGDQAPSNYNVGDDGNYGGVLAGSPAGGNYQPPAGLQRVVYQRNFHINRRCQAIAFHFEDIEPATSYGAAYELSELLLTGGAIGSEFKPGANRLG